jgi:hypothetical protein
MVFIIDLPRLPVPAAKGSQDMPFAVELARFLKAQGHADELVDSLDKYDFSKTASYGFIHTMSVQHLADVLLHQALPLMSFTALDHIPTISGTSRVRHAKCL